MATGGSTVDVSLGPTRRILLESWERHTPEGLEPIGGWVEEPLIRTADQVVPVSRQEGFLDRRWVTEEEVEEVR